MLKAFRQQGLTSAVWGLIIAATVVVFIVQFRPGAQGQTASMKLECVAEVRGRCLDPKEYRAELMLTAPARIIDPSQLSRFGIRKAALDGLVERTLLVQDAERLGLSVSDQELDDELTAGRAHVSLPVEKARMLAYFLHIPDDLVRTFAVNAPDEKGFDYKTYDRQVRALSGRSPTEFKAMQHDELLAARMRDLVRERVRVGDEEAFATYQREKSSATIRFATFRRGWFARHAVDSSPAAVDAWAAAHKTELDAAFETRKSKYLPECRTARHILVKLPEGATDEQKEEAHRKVDALLARVQKGENFATVAREESDDTSAPDGGDLGCFQRGRMTKPFDEAVFALSPGQISPVVETQFGLHIIKLEGVYKDADAEAMGRKETAKTLMVNLEAEALVAETAKKVLAAVKSGSKFDVAVSDALASLPAVGSTKTKKKARAKQADVATSDAKAKSGDPADDKPADIADAERPRVEISAPFNSTGDPVTGVTKGQNVAQMAFKLEKDGDTPDDLVKLDDGYAVIQLKEKSAATRDQFETEHDTFVAAMLAAKQADALNGYVMRLKEVAKSDTKVNEDYGRASAKEKQSESEEE
jgi:peptidyl-prolyl cis-trans isomerase D